MNLLARWQVREPVHQYEKEGGSSCSTEQMIPTQGSWVVRSDSERMGPKGYKGY